MIDPAAVTAVTRRISRKNFSHQFGRPNVPLKEKAVWRNVRDLGTRLWLDTGDIEEAERLWCSDFEALTTNNTLLNKEVQKGIYDELVRETAEAIRGVAPDIDEQRLVLEIAFVLNAYHALRLVEEFDAYVSVEVHTDLGHDVERTVAYGKRYYDICPERFYVKIPFTAAGLLATRELSQLGAPVNFTLGFSARQNYLAALFAKPAFVNVFMGRLNVFVVDNGLGDGKNVGEKATLATQRELLSLRQAKRTRSLLIGASMREGGQIPALGGLDVFTMPPKVAAQYEQNPIKGLSRQVEQDPPVKLGEFARVEDFGIETLWDIPERFRKAVDELLEQDIETLTPAEICTYFAHAGYPDFLPDYSEDDILTATADGKIPIYGKWRDRLTRGEIGLDALMNLSAFCSFATDQNALDTRIRSLL
ncbi:MAG: transaldolase family protein [Phycisphaerales bacterium]|nr:MAG: transaldolase family protein [Phycisphaerales bacterium]